MTRHIVRNLVRLPQRHDRAAHVGVIANTNGNLPSAALDRLAGVDLILHAGDIGDASVITRLQAVAPVIAVAGDHDRRARHPHYRILHVAGRLIALAHGHSLPATSHLLRLFQANDGDEADPRLAELVRAFPPVDCVVFAHPATACRIRVYDTLVFNPGCVAPPGRADAGSVGILTLGRHVDGSILQLGQPPTSSPVLAPA